MQKKKFHFFWVTILSFVVVYLFFKYGTPFIFKGIKGGDNLIPLPGTGLLMYTMLLLLAIFTYISYSAKKFEEFYGPIVRFLRDGNKTAYWIVMIITPLVIGFGVFNWTKPKSVSPTGIRIQHPGLPGSLGTVENPLRHPSPEAIEKFREEEKLGAISEEEVRLVMVEKYTNEGRALYQANCHPCHGCAADGNGSQADGFRLRPVNFTDPGAIATVVETYVYWRVREGNPSLPPESTPWDSAMPAWKYDYSDEQIWKIAMAAYDIARAMPRMPEEAHE